MFRRRLVGHIFFETTADSEVLKDIIIQFILKLEENERHCWLQQNGATFHIAREAMDLLKEYSDNRLICEGFWPPYHLTYSPLIYFSVAI
jgi:hypothetical protein